MSTPQYVYHMSRLNKQFQGGRQILKDISLSFLPGAKIAIIGPNGAGKSTLMRIMAGLDKEFTGEAWAADGVRVGYLEQEPLLDETRDVTANVMDGVAGTRALLEEFEAISARFAEPLDDDEMNDLIEQQGALQEKIDALGAWDLEDRVGVAMEALRCPPGDRDVASLSGGERRRVALCRLLLEKPDILMLDEPTNHLDAVSVAWLERFLQDYAGTVILVTHDRYFLDNVVGWVLELDRGRGIPFKGNYSDWLEAKAARLNVEERAEAARQKAIARELEWMRSSPRARQAKGKARLRSYDELLAQQQERIRARPRIIVQPPARLGNQVIDLKDVSKGYAGNLLIDGLDCSIPPNAIVGIIGPNGAGKSTLFRMITGEDGPDSGVVTLGETAQLAHVDQSRAALDADKTVWEEISGGEDVLTFGKSDVNSRAYVGAFNFKGADQQKKVGQLSGGERNRVHLAKLLRMGGNVLLLDEPTNDLDVETLSALEEALEDFAGTVLIVSHDRFFLDRLATHILAFEGDSHVEWFAGNYADYIEDLKRRKGDAAAEPRRIKFKKFER